MAVKLRTRFFLVSVAISVTVLFILSKWLLTAAHSSNSDMKREVKELFHDEARFESVQYLLENRASKLQYFQNQLIPPLSSKVSNKIEISESRNLEKCRDAICTNYLTQADFPHYRYCVAKTWHKKFKPGVLFAQEPKQSLCKFMDGSNRDPIALASYPGSGNTWVRGLLQGVTGLCTGATYCDVSLRKNGYPGESLRSGVVLAVKIHEVDPRWTGVVYNPSAPFTYFKRLEDVPVFSSAVFIMRNPLDAMVAEYNRLLLVEGGKHYVNHVENVDSKNFGFNPEWSSFVLSEAEKWQRTVLGWLTENRGHPVLVLKYEQLLTDTAEELKRVLDFLRVPYSAAQLEKVVQQGYDRFKRTHTDKEKFDHYTESQREHVKGVIRRTSKILSEHNSVNISEYLYVN